MAKTPDAEPWNRRLHVQRDDSTANGYAADRERIIHSDAFRALQYKTQVQGLIRARWPRLFRTRLNHVLEVAQIARELAHRTGAGATLAEAIALAHDLGHPPFGHAGERALREALQEHGHGAWNANLHSLVVVDEVEAAFIDFRGLNLTWATREGIARHSTPFDEPAMAGEFTTTPNAGLESQLVDAADIFAWLSHDLDDALAGGYLSLDDVVDVDPTLEQIYEASLKSWRNRPAAIWPDDERETLLRHTFRATLLSRLIEDTANTTTAALRAMPLPDPAAVRSSEHRLVHPSTRFAASVTALLQILTDRYYRSTEVADSDTAAKLLIRQLLERLIASPSMIPTRFRIGDDALNAATYLASLNDHSAAQLARDVGAGVDA